MDYYNYYWFLCLVSLKGLESANIYLVDLPVDEVIVDPQDYDDYGVIYDDFRHGKLKRHADNPTTVFCQRLFGSIYKNKDQHIRCLNALKLRQKLKRGRNKVKTALIPFKTEFKNPVGRDKAVKKHFSQDYLDVGDLARTDFASDYLDIDDFRGIRSIVPDCKDEIDEFGQMTKAHCLPASRKKLEELRNVRFKVEGSPEMEGGNDVFLRKKNKRFAVVSKEVDSSGSDSDKSDDVAASFSSSIQNSDSFEATTRKPKKTKRENEPYNYIQGNKWYDQDDFRNKLRYLRNAVHRSRRGLRMSHFLPKRYHWDEKDYQNLGYYWFNGPRGKYIAS